MGIRGIYDWALKQAEKPHAPWLLFFIALIEPWALPLPPDALMVPMALARRDRAFKLAAICMLGSLLGSMIGYAIGAIAIKTVGLWLIETYNRQELYEHCRQEFHKWGMLVIIAKGAVPVIPVPFFLVTIVSGVVHYGLGPLMLAVAIGRGARFFSEAALIYFYGEPIRIFIEKYLSWVALAIVACVGIWFWAVLR